MDASELDMVDDNQDGDTTGKYKDNSFKSRFARTFIFVQYPWSVWFIISQELCERFSFYGFKAILSKYLVDFLKFDEDNATALVHAFIFIAYFTPLLGAFLADAMLGKFWTILSLSIVYCIGQIVLSVTAIQGVTGTPPHWWGCAFGLIFIAFGTGGIKPCVSSFGGDQFKEDQGELLRSFFAVFYFSINLGSTVSSFVTPIFRNLWGYAVAFSIPAALLIIATVIFVAGKRTYRTVPPSGLRNNPYFKVFGVVYHALKNWRNPQYISVRSWLDRAEAKYDRATVYDVKCVLGVVKVLIPIIVFWALFDQHSTRFVFQADRMNRKVGKYEFTADQVTTLNPILVLSLVVLFDRVIYKGLDYIRLSPRPLKRIAVGFLFTILSFISAAIVEIFVVRNDGTMGKERIHIAWQLPQWVLLCVGEILVSVTGLELAYSQAPKSMKSLMQSYYLLTVSIGNMIVVAVAKLGLPKKYIYRQVYEFLFFAALMALAFILFVFLALSFKYRKIVEEESTNPAYEDDELDQSETQHIGA